MGWITRLRGFQPRAIAGHDAYDVGRGAFALLVRATSAGGDEHVGPDHTKRMDRPGIKKLARARIRMQKPRSTLGSRMRWRGPDEVISQHLAAGQLGPTLMDGPVASITISTPGFRVQMR